MFTINRSRVSSIVIASFALSLGFQAGQSRAETPLLEGTPIIVKGQFLSGKNVKKKCKDPTCDLQTDEDISAGICLAGKPCFAASDESRFVQEFVFSQRTITAGRRLYLTKTDQARERRHKADELDLEALATDGAGIFAIGSHSFKRRGCKPHKSRHAIFYFKPAFDDAQPRKPVASTSFKLDKTVNDIKELSESLGRALQLNGLNIEGAAVLQDELLIGFRAPYSDENANNGFVLAIEAKAARRGDVKSPKLHQLPFARAGIGIRAMEPLADGVLLLTGDAGAGKGKKETACEDKKSRYLGNPAQLYFWNGDDTQPKLLGEVKLPEAGLKAEGVMLDPLQDAGSDGVDVIIFFDGKENGYPHRYTIPRSRF